MIDQRDGHIVFTTTPEEAEAGYRRELKRASTEFGVPVDEVEKVVGKTDVVPFPGRYRQDEDI